MRWISGERVLDGETEVFTGFEAAFDHHRTSCDPSDGQHPALLVA
jgi:hypothetical protein